MKMIEEFQRRAKKRNRVAYILLILSILLIICGIILIIIQLQDLMDNQQTDIFNIISRLSFIVLLTFITQTLQKLYRYNILKADYFLSCADSLRLCNELSNDNEEKFIKIMASLNGADVTLTETDSPNFPFLTQPKEK